ncbi:uncharacterized protein SPSC_04417 [Sporisorium scitamineum]|uniref:Uncharacterized protein n=1 Tax=Sporisorium scitamineum TaxID=49012 RepID=A0A0F7S6A0_9BASI|nr:uncharacterized protein SPSC_04417 [Sporisorium scitamineum]CDW98447.1 hypothetical protein [Sporisorium scitamineum]
MDSDAVVLGTITFEELPLHVELHQSTQALQPSSIEEDKDDPRSLLYLFEDNDFERAAAFLAIDEARQQAQVEAAAEALIEAEVERQRTRALANRLRQLLEEDDELVDMLGRRILATNGYQVPDLWHPHHYHHLHHHRHDSHQHASGSRGPVARSSGAASLLNRPRYTDIHAAWDQLAKQTDMSLYPGASPFIHSAPIILRGHAPYLPEAAQHITAPSRSPATVSAPPAASKAPTHTHTTIAIHPLTGVPMLLLEEHAETNENPSSHTDATMEFDAETQDETDEWPIDESDIDWLGRELLRLRGGANVWVLGADHDVASLPTVPSSSQSASTASSAAQSAQQSEPESAPPTLPTHVEEVDSDHELHNVARVLQPGLVSPSQRVAAALTQAALHTPSSKPETSTAGQRTRQRAVTVMSESEEEELETVGRPVEEHGEQKAVNQNASSLNDRPRKTVKVVDLR